MSRTISERVKQIQLALGVEPDGQLGPQTLDALEKRLRITPKASAPEGESASVGLTLTQQGLAQIIAYEVGSEAYYHAKLTAPVWPGGESGVTIGIGYDLGYASVDQFERHWNPFLNKTQLTRLRRACGRKGLSAKKLIPSLAQIHVPYTAAQQVFIQSSLPQYAAKTRDAFPGVQQLAADAQVALLSLVYNRGTKMEGASRTEMKAIRTLVPRKDYPQIAANLRRMKRLWEGRGLDGLLKRRDHEAELVARCQREYDPQELLRI